MGKNRGNVDGVGKRNCKALLDSSNIGLFCVCGIFLCLWGGVGII